MRIEQTGVLTWVRESTSILGFPTILLLHTIGMALVVGVVAGIDLRILGFAPALPLASMEKFLPALWLGLGINTVTGLVLLAANASKWLTDADFYVKMVFIGLAVVNLRLTETRVLRDSTVDKGPLTTDAKVLAWTSLFLWLGAVTAGRLLAYVGVTG